jgi:hypothetical protein
MISKVKDIFPSGAKKGGLLLMGFAAGIGVCRFTDIEQLSLGTDGISFQTRTPNDVEQFRSVRADPDRWTVYVSLLAEEGLYAADNPQVVEAITELCDSIPSEPLEAYLAASAACAERPVPTRLRRLSREQDPPFHPVGIRVTVGVPSPDDQPPPGNANTCQNGDLYRRDLLLINPIDGTRQVEVQASGHYGQGLCGQLVGTADIQLNEADAFSIFDGPLAKFEQALAIIIN